MSPTHPETIIQHRPKKLPDLEPLGSQSRSRAVMETVLAEIYTATGFTPESKAEADLKDGIEELLRTHAGLRHCDPQQTWFRLLHPEAKLSSIIALGGQDAEPPETAQIYGPGQDTLRHSHSHAQPEELDYWHIEAVHSRMGRKITTAGFSPDDGSADVVGTISSRFPGTSKKQPVFVKPTATKSLPSTEGWIGDYDMLSTASEAWDWAEVRLEGRSNTVLIQELIPMQYEYRIFVINHSLAAGAGCLEEKTPLQNTAQLSFDPRMRKDRLSTATPMSRRSLLQHYLSFAAETVAEIAQQRPELSHYVLDLALSDDRPVIVELNSIGAAGLYCADPYAIAEQFFTS